MCVRPSDDGSDPEIVAKSNCDGAGLTQPSTHQVCNFDVTCPLELARVNDGPCSHSCGGGVKKPRLVCRRSNNQGSYTVYKLTDCANVTRIVGSALPVPCNHDVNCPPFYRLGEWTPCSTSCGLGVRSRLVRCYERSHGSTFQIKTSTCHKALGREPHSKKCELAVCRDNFKWKTTEWSMVS